ncbi:MAG: AMP-binding protein, partial [bacterium]|nr:AMP-binding protein [bacterium]
ETPPRDNTEDERLRVLSETGCAWVTGGKIDWPDFYGRYPQYFSQKRYRVFLPTYPFERQNYFIENTGAAETIETPKTEPPTGFYKRPKLSTEYVVPSTGTQQSLAAIWQRFFGIREVGIRDDFFELGGDSLKVITVVTEVHKQMDVRVPILQMFDSTTIEKLAEYIDGSAKEEYLAVEPVEKKEYYPLSSVQMRIYILQQIERAGTGYNTPLVFEMEGEIDREKLADTFNKLIRRHESLRTSFQLIEGENVQRVHADVDFKIEYYDTGISHFIRPFDLSRAPLVRVGMIMPAGGATPLFMVDMHHIITDGSSIGVLMREFMAYYAGESLEPLPIQYRDYTQWQNSETQKQAMMEQRAYWLDVFGGEIPVLNLPIDYPRPAVQSFEGNVTYFEISPEETGALKALALKEDTTLFMVLLSLYSIFLSKISSQEDIVVGTPTAGRRHADLQRLIGMLVNTLALRNFPSEPKSYKDFLKEVRRNTLGAFENQDYLFEDLVEEVTENMKVGRDVSRNPIFDTMFALQNFESQYEAERVIETPGLIMKPYVYERGIAIFDLNLQCIESREGISCSFEFCTKLFKPETIDCFTGYFKTIISTVIAAPDTIIAEIGIISEEEKRRILHDFSGPEVEDIPQKLIHQLFEEQAEKTPHRTALRGPWGHCLTYSELNNRAEDVACSLMENGVAPGDIAGVMIERSVEMILGILGILKAGAAYLPIDPNYPQDRIDFMLADSNAKIVVDPTHPALRAPLSKGDLKDFWADSQSKSLLERALEGPRRGTPKGGGVSIAY